jgi:hypothetical protein
MIFLTLVLVNKLVNFELKAKRAYLFYFLIYKKITCIAYQIRILQQIYSEIIEKGKKSVKDSQINSKGSTNLFFWNFLMLQRNSFG